jgi:hypothetical protein
MFRKMIFAVAGLLPALMVSNANAAEVWEKKISGVRTVFVRGDIVPEDYEQFHKLTNKLPAGTPVVLNSNGGKLAAGVKIGEFIRLKRFRSIALDTCASVCALMWLAGTPRFVFSDAAVGFHSAYKEDGSVTGGGNAIIGAYLAKLGFKYETIYYLTQTAPKEMEWLNSDKAKQHGISATVLPSQKDKSS